MTRPPDRARRVTILLDTHAWAWAVNEDEALSPAARRAIAAAPRRLVSVVSVFEIAQKVRIGKWPEMEGKLDDLPALIEAHGVGFQGVTAEVARVAGSMPWPNRDPFDRLIAATALATGLPLVSADAAFDTLPGLRRLW